MRMSKDPLIKFWVDVDSQRTAWFRDTTKYNQQKLKTVKFDIVYLYRHLRKTATATGDAFIFKQLGQLSSLLSQLIIEKWSVQSLHHTWSELAILIKI